MTGIGEEGLGACWHLQRETHLCAAVPLLGWRLTEMLPTTWYRREDIYSSAGSVKAAAPFLQEGGEKMHRGERGHQAEGLLEVWFWGIYRISSRFRDVLDDLSMPAMPPLLLPRFEEEKDFKQALFVNIGEKTSKVLVKNKFALNQ